MNKHLTRRATLFSLVGLTASPLLGQRPSPVGRKPAAQLKAETLMIPELLLVEADLWDCCAVLNRASARADTEPDVTKRGVNFLSLAAVNAARVTMTMRKVSLWHAVDAVIEATNGLAATATDFAIMLHSKVSSPPLRSVPAEVQREAAWKHAAAVVIERVSFYEAELPDVCRHLVHKSKELGHGIRINCTGDPLSVILDLRNIRLTDLLIVVASLSGTAITASNGGIVLRG
jgi:hypothetical protein